MFKLTPEARQRATQTRAFYAARRNEFAALSDRDLVSSARFWMAHMQPLHYAPGEPVYDATMWHVILPELLRRLEGNVEMEIKDRLHAVEITKGNWRIARPAAIEEYGKNAKEAFGDAKRIWSEHQTTAALVPVGEEVQAIELP